MFDIERRKVSVCPLIFYSNTYDPHYLDMIVVRVTDHLIHRRHTHFLAMGLVFTCMADAIVVDDVRNFRMGIRSRNF